MNHVAAFAVALTVGTVGALVLTLAFIASVELATAGHEWAVVPIGLAILFASVWTYERVLR